MTVTPQPESARRSVPDAAALYSKYGMIMRQAAHRRLDGRGRDVDADDIVQEVVLGVLFAVGRDTMGQVQDWEDYLVGAVGHRVDSVLKNRNRSATIATDLLDATDADIEAPTDATSTGHDPTADVALRRLELRQAWRAAERRHGSRDMRTAWRSLVESAPKSEIAADMDISQQRIGQVIRQFTETLADQLTGGGSS